MPRHSAVVFVSDGSEELEAVTIVDVLRRASIDVRLMSTGAAAIVPCSRGVALKADSIWDEAAVKAADLLVVPGGMGGMQRMRADKRVVDAVRDAYSGGRLVAAICAGPCVLAEAGVLVGRKVTCYPGMEDQLKGACCVRERAFRDGKIITGNGPASAIPFALELVRSLEGSRKSDEVAQGLLV